MINLGYVKIEKDKLNIVKIGLFIFISLKGSLKYEGYGGIEPLKYDLQSNCTTLYHISLV